MRVNKTKTHHNINSLNKVKIFKLFRVSFFSFCFIATLVSITQVFPKSSSVFAEGDSGNSNNTVSTSSSATASVTVSSACSFTRTNNDYNESTGYTGTLINGDDVEVPGSTFKTICNDPGGYSIYAIGYSNNTLGNTDLIFNNTPTSENNIKTDGDTLSGSNGSYWKMKATSPTENNTVATIESAYNNTYGVIPSTYTKIASLNTITDSAGTAQANIKGSSISITYKAYASSTQPAGTYTGAVKYTMVHPNVTTGNPYIIIFDSNGGAGDMNAQAILPNTSTPLSANEFTPPADQGFGGWCTTSTANCADGTLYANEQAINNLTTAGGEITLYAMWGKTIANMTYLQDFANQIDKNSIIGSMAPETTYTKKDKRDEQDYTIAKLKDNKVWMTKNLNLAGGTEVSYEDTDFESIYTPPTTNGWTVSNNKLVLPLSSTSGFDIDNYAYIYNSGRIDCSSPGCYSYYSWDAATLGSGRALNEDNVDAPYSICPKGWRLPNVRAYASSNWQAADFYQLAIAYGMNPSHSMDDTEAFYNNAGPNTAPNFIFTGHYTNGSFSGDDEGIYWGSTSGIENGDILGGRGFSFSASIVHAVNGSARRHGYPLRCLAK